MEEKGILTVEQEKELSSLLDEVVKLKGFTFWAFNLSFYFHGLTSLDFWFAFNANNGTSI